MKWKMDILSAAIAPSYNKEKESLKEDRFQTANEGIAQDSLRYGGDKYENWSNIRYTLRRK